MHLFDSKHSSLAIFTAHAPEGLPALSLVGLAGLLDLQRPFSMSLPNPPVEQGLHHLATNVLNSSGMAWTSNLVMSCPRLQELSIAAFHRGSDDV